MKELDALGRFKNVYLPPLTLLEACRVFFFLPFSQWEPARAPGDKIQESEFSSQARIDCCCLLFTC